MRPHSRSEVKSEARKLWSGSGPPEPRLALSTGRYFRTCTGQLLLPWERARVPYWRTAATGNPDEVRRQGAAIGEPCHFIVHNRRLSATLP